MQQQVTAAILALQGLQQTLAALAPPVAAKKPVGRPKRAAVSLPEASEDGAPTAGDYRLKEEEIKMDSCLGRRLNESSSCKDKRWKPAVYREFQCGGKTVEGSNLCEACNGRLEKYVEAPKPGAWTGRVTEEPLDWVHMLGTAWAEWRQPKWIGVATSATGSEAGSAAGTSAEAAVVVEGELTLIGRSVCMVKGRDVYEYDSLTETVGDLLGELSEDGESITLLEVISLIEQEEKEKEEALTMAKETFAKRLAKAAAVAEAAKAEKAAAASAAAKAKAEKAAAAAREKAVKAAAVAKARAEKAAAAAADAQNKAEQAARDALFLALIAPDDVGAHAE